MKRINLYLNAFPKIYTSFGDKKTSQYESYRVRILISLGDKY